MGAHTWLYRASGGRVGHRVPGFGPSMLLLDHVGARSGAKRTSPLLYIPDGENVVIVASKGGYPKHPDTTVQIGSELRPVHARVATPEERERLWPKVVETYRPYADYQARSKGREIPLVILEPRR
jgi:deazaflavin-dependent oxidoreductase (nitroreductase family)